MPDRMINQQDLNKYSMPLSHIVGGQSLYHFEPVTLYDVIDQLMTDIVNLKARGIYLEELHNMNGNHTNTNIEYPNSYDSDRM